MFIFKKKAVISEEDLRNFIQLLEQTYVGKDELGLSKLFHPENRNVSFLNHFQMQMLFQIYNIKSEILHFKTLDVSENEATLTYTRKHIYTCINSEDEREESPNNITSYYVKLVPRKKSFLITKFSPFSVFYLDNNGEILAQEKAVVPKDAQFFGNIKRFIKCFQLEKYKPATYKIYSDSEFIGYYPKDEVYDFETSEKFTIDYFEEMDASTIEEHTKAYLDQELLLGEVIEQKETYSIIETQFADNSGLNHELVLSMLAPDGFFMVRYQKSCNQIINNEIREFWIQQMKEAIAEINNVPKK
ncbi:hypothetical protein [Aneurinibacillus danicus]|uniref:Uncharacterized protein n=1 Tax=Aneurinibacillus danicus TaxID=267746 RepID=A0A511V4E9_9BACL|nr:hypothetical protein [Aneurinibacillus danicus]GEN33659.1 hypothetical protein ADA01nite_11190 [Aneurinibacillus danicus]